jgi:hypothetical protein
VSKSSQVQRWELIIEEFSPDLVYINGPRIVVADALSRLDPGIFHLTLNSDSIPKLFESSNDKSLNTDYPLITAAIATHEQKDKTPVQYIKCHPRSISPNEWTIMIFLLLNKKV